MITKADWKALGKAAAKEEEARQIAVYRLLHKELNPQARDATVKALIHLETFKR